nr:GNAT family N-acetyltransferase [Okeania sp. SIO2F4]
MELGYLLNLAYWYQGLATEASKASLISGFEELKLKEIVAIAKPKNLASQKLMEKLGMKYEKDANYYQTNVVYYKISKKEDRYDSSFYILEKSSQLMLKKI